MNNKVFNLVASYTSCILANYQAIAKLNAATPALRLISEESNKKDGEIYFKIQLTGKNIFPVVSLKDLSDPATISNFSKRDQDIIRNYLCYGKMQIRKRISARTYDRVTKQFMYVIEAFDPALKVMKCFITDNPASLLPEINNFDKEDAFLIETSLRELISIENNCSPTIENKSGGI